MTEFERQLLDRIESLEKEVRRLKSDKEPVIFTPEEIAYFEALPASATVGKDYVAYRFKCSLRSAQRGDAGTDAIPRASRRPLKFIKEKVDEVWRRHSKTPEEKAAEARAKAKKVRRPRSNGSKQLAA